MLTVHEVVVACAERYTIRLGVENVTMSGNAWLDLVDSMPVGNRLRQRIIDALPAVLGHGTDTAT